MDAEQEHYQPVQPSQAFVQLAKRARGTAAATATAPVSDHLYSFKCKSHTHAGALVAVHR